MLALKNLFCVQSATMLIRPKMVGLLFEVHVFVPYCMVYSFLSDEEREETWCRGYGSFL